MEHIRIVSRMTRLSPALLAGLAIAPAFAETAAPAPQEPARIRRAETIVYDNWTVACALTDREPAKRTCSAALKIAQTDTSGAQRVVFTWVVARRDGKLVSAISVPSGVQIPPGMEVRIGDREARKIGYAICMPDHCESRLPLEETIVKRLSAAATTEVTIRAANGAEAKFTVNMKGFAQALADIGK